MFPTTIRLFALLDSRKLIKISKLQMGGFCLEQRKLKKISSYREQALSRGERTNWSSSSRLAGRSLQTLYLRVLRKAIVNLDSDLFGNLLIQRNFNYTSKIAALTIKKLVIQTSVSIDSLLGQWVILRLSNITGRLSVIQLFNILANSPIALSSDFRKIYFRAKPAVSAGSGFRFDAQGNLI
jgi:hypothetical protein